MGERVVTVPRGQRPITYVSAQLGHVNLDDAPVLHALDPDQGAAMGGPARSRDRSRRRRSAVRNLERVGLSRSVGMKLTGHKTEAVYWRYAIGAEGDLREAGAKLAAALGTDPAMASLSDNLGDNPVTARKERSLNA